MNRPIMFHVVAGYPDSKSSLELILGMHERQAAAIEVQIPFSDPIADGETIMQANDVALAGGMTTQGSFELIKEARKCGVNTDIYIMSYLQKVRHFGFETFCKSAKACGVKGLIIPDLPYDTHEFTSLHTLAGSELQLVPVLSPGMMESRLDDLLALKPGAVYVTSVQGITGNSYSPAKQLTELVAAVKQRSEAQIMIGFGISNKHEVNDALKLGDIAVVGSAVIKVVESKGVPAALDYIQSLLTDQS